MARKLAASALLAGALLALPPEALAQYRGGVAPPDSATDTGDAINQIYWVVLAACAVVFVAIQAVLVFFLLRFRRRRDAPAATEGPQIHGNTRLEILWTVIPAAALVALAVYTLIRVPDVEAEPTGDERRGAVVVDVEAHQFYWQYRYPNGSLSYDTLYLPAERKVTLRLSSADVPHSWWVPELTGKRDALPGQVNELHFTVEGPGTFEYGKCGEMCGIQHAFMLTRVEVLPAEEFDGWLAENEGLDEIELGGQEWAAACAKCHGMNGEGDIGPTIAGNPALTSFETMDALVRREGQNLDTNEGYMPPVGKGWTDAQLEALIAYIESNEKLAPAGAGGNDGG